MKKNIIFTLIGLVIGLAIGCFGTMAYFGHSLATTMFMLQEKEIFEIEDAAVKAYYDQPTEIGVWALENYISRLNRLKEERSSAEVENPYFILNPDHSFMYTHARLGHLYKKLNDTEKSKYHFDKAMSKRKEIGLRALDTEEKLIDFIHKLDSGADSVDKEN